MNHEPKEETRVDESEKGDLLVWTKERQHLKSYGQNKDNSSDDERGGILEREGSYKKEVDKRFRVEILERCL